MYQLHKTVVVANLVFTLILSIIMWQYGGTGIGFACLLVALHNLPFIIYFAYTKNKPGWQTALLMMIVLLLVGLILWWVLGPKRLY